MTTVPSKYKKHANLVKCNIFTVADDTYSYNGTTATDYVFFVFFKKEIIAVEHCKAVKVNMCYRYKIAIS